MRRSSTTTRRVVATGSTLLKRLLAGDRDVPYVLFRHKFDYGGSSTLKVTFQKSIPCFQGLLIHSISAIDYL